MSKYKLVSEDKLYKELSTMSDDYIKGQYDAYLELVEEYERLILENQVILDVLRDLALYRGIIK